jgi:hypothetical protein
MMTRRSLAAVWAAISLGAAAIGCGEDGQSVRANDACPNQPIFHWQPDGGTWVRLDPDNKPLSPAQNKAIDTEPDNCRTKAGQLVSYSDGGTN